MFSEFNPSKCTHTRGAVGGSVPCSRVSPQSWTIPTQSRDSNPQPRVTSPMLYPLEPRLPQKMYLHMHMSRLDYCNALLAGLPASSIKPLQLIQNAAARLIFNEPKRTHVTPLFINLHWLPIAARIKFKALMFAYRTTSGSAPLYLNSLLQTYVPSRSLRSASEQRITFIFMHLADAFIQKATYNAFRLYICLVSMCVPWESNPQSLRC